MGTLERLEDRLADLCGHRNVLDALLVQLVAEALETGAWEMHGIVHRRIGWRGKPACRPRTRSSW